MWSSGTLFFGDVILSAILIRVVLGVLISYRGLIRFFFLAAILAGVVYITRQMQLALTNLLVLALAVPVAFLLVINVFPEFKRLSRAVLAGRLFWARAVPEKLVSSITSALIEMAQQRVGALFVFTRRDDVSPLISGGEEILAAPNKSLLLSLFNPKSPRHDGAIVIEGGQLIRIGAVLPLASAEGVHEEWGTRHLAAAGLTSQCDAHVLVVSEERGAISHASKGDLRVIFPQTEENVRISVEQALGLNVDRNRRMRRITFEIFLWTVAIIMAVFGSITATRVTEWFKNEPVDIRSFAADISFKDIPADLSVDGIKESSCTVFLRVPRATRFLGTPNLIVNVELAKYPPGPVTINLSRQMLNLQDWEVERFEPEQLKFQLVKNRSINLAIKPIVSGLRPELRIRRIRTQPEQLAVEVRGAQWRDNFLPTLPVDLSGISIPGSYSFSGQINMPAAIRYHNGTDKIPIHLEVDVTGR